LLPRTERIEKGLMLGKFCDVALRDLGLAPGAFALSRLALARERDRL
jgi:hypothetical protein